MKTDKSNSAGLNVNLLALGAAFAALVWVAEAFVDTYVFSEDDLVSSLFPVEDSHELLDRAIVAFGLMALVSYSQFAINKRKRAEAALREVGERFRSLVQHGSDIITVLDADSTIKYASPSVERILGYTADGMVGTSSFDYIHPDDMELVSGSMAELVQQPGVHLPIEFRIRHADGSWCYFESIANNLVENPVVQGIVVNSRNVTERRQAEEALARTLEARTQFITDVSHELRTPLTVLRGNAEVGLEIGCDCVHKEILAKLVVQSKRISRMVEDLLFLARSDSESLPLGLKSVAVVRFLEELASLAEALVRERGADLHAELSGEGEARIDPEKIEQAVLILVDNAAQYSPKGEQVNFTAKTEAGELRFEIADRGPGIPEAELPQIFERFYRSERAKKDNRSGSGLGLSIAKTIADAHGGRIRATSRVNEGTRMQLCVPLGGDSLPANERPPADAVAEVSTAEDAKAGAARATNRMG